MISLKALLLACLLARNACMVAQYEARDWECAGPVSTDEHEKVDYGTFPEPATAIRD